MSVAIMVNKGLSLRKALRSVGSSQGAYYYKRHTRQDKGALRDPSIISTVRDIALKKPMYGTRMMAALLSKELRRPINRKQVQHAYRMMGWIAPRLTRNEVLKSVSDKIPKPNGINQSWQTDLTYIRCGIDGFGYLFNVIDVFSREWLAYVFDGFARKENAVQAVVKALGKHPEASGKVTLYSDNGSQYISETFEQSMKALGIKQRYIAYNTPEQNGSIESFHGRFKREYVWPYDFRSFQEADSHIAEAFIDYNERRPHSALGYMSPYEFISRIVVK